MKFSFVVAASILLAVALGARAAEAVGPSVRDVVEFTSIVQPRGHDPEAMKHQVSPDGSRAFILTRKADVASDINRYEIVLLSLAPDRLSTGRAAAPETVYTLLAQHDAYLGDSPIQQVQWQGDHTLIFLGRLDGQQDQVYGLDLGSKQLQQLTHAVTPISSFAVSSDLRRVVYAAREPNPPMKDGARSIVYGNQSFWSVRDGQRKWTAQVEKYQYYVADVRSPLEARRLGQPFPIANAAPPTVSISPDGRWALLPRYEPSRTLEWSEQYPMVAEVSRKFGPGLRSDPLRYYSGALVQCARRMTAWRLDDGHEQTVVDAPDDALPGFLQFRSDRLWQDGGTSVILAGTHLPLTNDGQTSTASHVIEYWPDSGRWKIVAKLQDRLGQAIQRGDGFQITDGKELRIFKRAGAAWQEVPDAANRAPKSTSPSGWTVRLEDALNQPPDAVATGPTGQTVRLTTLNPQFDPDTWGRMKTYTWRDAHGRPWTGGLLGGDAAKGSSRLPLVIQAYLYTGDHFYLDGPNNNFDSPGSAFPGRAFEGTGVLVLAMGFRPDPGSAAVTDGPEKSVLFYEGVRGAVDALVREGRVDPARIGIIGWSTTGESVLNLVTFSDLPIRAATLADGDANTLFTYSLTYGFFDATWGHIERLNQGGPFGSSRADWLRNDPALNTDCINAALRIESYGDSLLPNYDVYAQLRRQYRPAEMVLIPGGFHSLGLPSERMISLQGNVDWYRFWLTGEKRREPLLAGETNASLRAQYDAWDQMAKMKAANDTKPRCSREPSRG